jgi:hypothetical protein
VPSASRDEPLPPPGSLRPPRRVHHRRVSRLSPEDVACWVLKSNRLPSDLVPGWPPGGTRELIRCVRPSYRLTLLRRGQPCLLWVSGRVDPGVHALGGLTDAVAETAEGPVVAVRWTLLAFPVPRAALLGDPAARDAEVLRMPAGSNPSWLSAGQYAAVLSRVARSGRPAGPGSGARLGP